MVDYRAMLLETQGKLIDANCEIFALRAMVFELEHPDFAKTPEPEAPLPDFETFCEANQVPVTRLRENNLPEDVHRWIARRMIQKIPAYMDEIRERAGAK